MFKGFIDKFTEKNNKIMDSLNMEEQKVDESDFLGKGETEKTYYQAQTKKTEDKCRPNLFKKLKDGLSKTKNGIVGRVDDLHKLYKKIDEDLF